MFPDDSAKVNTLNFALAPQDFLIDRMYGSRRVRPPSSYNHQTSIILPSGWGEAKVRMSAWILGDSGEPSGELHEK